MIRPAFLDQEPPPGYIAGVGRGATGFSTRGQKQAARIPKRYLNEEAKSKDLQSDDEDEDVFAAIDEKLKNRRKKKKGNDTSDSKVKFEDLKQKLGTISENQWLDLPEAVDITRKNKRDRLEEQFHRRTYAAPDTLLKNKGVNLSKLTEERERILARQLDTNFFADNEDEDNTQKYLNELDNDKPALDIEDNEEVQKRRLILQSYRRTEPKDPTSWISSARLEENCGNYSEAKSLIQQGCLQCPRDEDIWLENIRLNETDVVQRKILVANAIRFLPKSTALWVKAIQFETERSNKYRVVRKAIKEIPYSLELWKMAVKFEQDKSEVVRILKKALEFLPGCHDFWLALIDLAPYSEVKTLLNNMTSNRKDDKNLYIFIATLEEKSNPSITVSELKKILEPAFTVSDDISTDELLKWIHVADNLALNNDKGLLPYVLSDILLGCLGVRVLEIVNSDLLKSTNSEMIKIAMYKNLLKYQGDKVKMWMELKNLCVSIENISIFFTIFNDLLFNDFPKNSLLMKHPHLSLLYAKELWKHYQSSERVLEILNKTLLDIPLFLEGWFAKLKILIQIGEIGNAEKIFTTLLQFDQDSKLKPIETERVLYKHIDFLRYCNKNDAALQLLESQYLQKYPLCYKLHLQLAQIHEELKLYEKVISDYEKATTLMPNSAILWIEYSRFIEMKMHNLMKARSILDIGILKSPENPTLLKARIELELRQNNLIQANLLISQGIQKFRKDEWMWVLSIRANQEKKSAYKKTLFQDALKATDNSYLVLFEIGKSFYIDNQFSIALKWFDRSLSKNKKFGDAWYYKTLCFQSLKKDIKECKNCVIEEEPKYGELWIAVSKKIPNIYKPASEIFEILLRDKDQ